MLVEVAIVGAGPYGLSVAAHLRHAGVSYRIFGEPMKFWKPMPKDLCLKSFGFATSIYAPRKGYEFPRWLAARGLETLEPISYAHFYEYGLWAQQQLVPDVEPVDVARLEDTRGGVFDLTLASGEQLQARSVVVAVGLGAFKRLPEELAGLPRSLVSHSAGTYDFRAFAGQEVAVIGAGQSALEMAVLLHEQGARPKLISRRPPYFYQRMASRRGLVERLRNPVTVVGTGRLNWVLEKFPFALHYAPEERRARFTTRYLGPSGAWWLRDRFVDKVSVLSPARIVSAHQDGSGVVLQLARPGEEASSHRFAHVVCGSGFHHDLARLGFLDPALAGRVALIQGRAPRLSRHFESSVAGLYFVGPVSALSFGPLVRFVCGAAFTAPVVAGHLAARRGLVANLLGRAAALTARSQAPGSPAA